MKQKIKNKTFKKICIALSVIIFLIALLYYFQYIINPVIYQISEGHVRASTVKCVNNAISEVVSDENVYESLCSVVTDENGSVSMINANALRINSITKELIKVSQAKIEKIALDSVKIPIGNFTGIPLLSGLGPSVKIRLVPMGSMSCYFVSEFKQAGINQTNHKIYVNFESFINLVMPLESRTISTQSQILICECIIVGKVPEVYFNSLNNGNLMNLVP